MTPPRPPRDWTEAFGLPNPQHNGSVDPAWMEDVLWMLCKNSQGLQRDGCDKWQRIKWVLGGIALGCGVAGGAVGAKLVSLLGAIGGGG